jgi:hypothetical protein
MKKFILISFLLLKNSFGFTSENLNMKHEMQDSGNGFEVFLRGGLSRKEWNYNIDQEIVRKQLQKDEERYREKLQLDEERYQKTLQNFNPKSFPCGINPDSQNYYQEGPFAGLPRANIFRTLWVACFKQ